MYIKTALIGKKYGVEVLLPAIYRIKKIKLKAICGKNKNINIEKQKNMVRYYYSWKEMLNKENIDLVIIATPPYIQEKIIKVLIKKKIPFMAQKPFTVSFENTKKFYKDIIKSKLPVTVDYNFIFLPIFIKFRKIIKNIPQNQINKYEIKWHFQSYAYKNKIISWKVNKKRGGGTLNNFGSHIIAVIQNFFGSVEKVDVFKSKLNWGNYFNNKNSDNVIVNTTHYNKINGSISICPNVKSKKELSVTVYTNNFSLKLINITNNHHSGFKIYKIIKNKKKLLNSQVFAKNLDPRILPSTRILKNLVNNILNKNKIKNDINFIYQNQNLIKLIE